MNTIRNNFLEKLMSKLPEISANNVEKSIFNYSLIIALIKLGITYVVLDRKSPSKRLLNDCLSGGHILSPIPQWINNNNNNNNMIVSKVTLATVGVV
mgnify:CR=1 FL=1